MKSVSGSLVTAFLSIVAVGCSSGTSDGPSGASSGASGSSGAPDGAVDAVDSGSSSSGSSGGAGGVPASCAGDEGGTVPTSAVPLQAWLAKRAYRCWAHESVQHKSTGPHGGEVKAFLNAKLEGSMKGTAEHAEGAVAVKEFFATGGTEVTGWAVLVKTQASSASGQGFYWYETFGTTPGASTIEGQGKALCVGCHSGGKDFVLTPYPLR